ncbi:MAG: short-chain dehydrogenase, partial [Ralstonia sp.]|nr:short-chain dehydrogenase [Ralstonia sp.]MBA4296169.1 short-chain dehydrogenase [Ralstonia sp.]
MSDTSLFILTGASRGLGAALAQALMQPGHRLICVARGDNAELRAQAA